MANLSGPSTSASKLSYFPDQMQTTGWSTLELLHLPANAILFEHIPRPYPEPSAARDVRTSLFEAALVAKRDKLQSINPHNTYHVGEHETGLALFVTKPDLSISPVMWDGTTISTNESKLSVDAEGRRVLRVFPIKYSEWTACTDTRFAQEYRNAGQAVPFVGVGVSVLIETADGLIPLTRRGIETPVYPGSLYLPGGGPQPGQTSIEALIEEIVEETGLQKGIHFDPSALVALAYVSDVCHQGSEHERPEIVFYLPTTISMKALVAHRNRTVEAKGQRPGDVWSMEPILADEYSLAGKVIYDGNQMCPPTEAGLVHLMYYKLKQNKSEAHAQEVVSHTLAQLTKYARVPYKPPISLAESDLPSRSLITG